ncbi:MAG: hypothetical protein ACI4F9_09585 [Lachnospiraceae bacterium]
MAEQAYMDMDFGEKSATGLNFRCENCGGVMEFNSEVQKMKCPHCGSEKDVHDMKIGDVNFSHEDFKIFKCSSCGAELLTDENTTSTFCSYCGNATLIESRVTGENAPTYIIPFKYKKEKAIEEFSNWCKKGVLTPNIFKDSTTIEKISGIYVPFWLFDVDGQLQASGECTKVRHSSDEEYDYVHTSYYHIHRDINASFSKIPADASKKMDDAIMDKLEPFYYDELQDFNMAYLSGYLSEKYNMDFEELMPRIKQRADGYMDVFLDRELAMYDGKSVKSHKNICLNQAMYAVLPVWILNYRYQGKNYIFAMNGQTGRIVADLPWSKKKAAIWFVGLTVLFTIILMIIGMVIG